MIEPRPQLGASGNGRGRRKDYPRPADWDPFAPLEYSPEGFLFPARRTWIERLWHWLRGVLRLRRDDDEA